MTNRKKNLCVITPYLPTISESFIRAHIERLPANVTLVYGWPVRIGKKRVISPAAQIANKILTAISGEKRKELSSPYTAALRNCQAEAVLCEYGTTGVLAMEACHYLNIPMVVHFHGYDASVHQVLQENAENYKRMFEIASGIIAVSMSMKRKLIELGAPEEKTHYNPYGIDCDRFRGAHPQNAPPVFIAVGRFVEKKAPLLTLEAFAKVHAVFPEARLRMIGDGPLLEECRTFARQTQLENVVTFLGARSHTEVQQELERARCFVQHSVEAANGDSEGMPLGILEAGASGLPVVSTLHAGIPDAVVDGTTGFLVTERDVDGMGAQMLKLAGKPVLAGQLGLAARKHVLTNFSENKQLAALWSIIETNIL